MSSSGCGCGDCRTRLPRCRSSAPPPALLPPFPSTLHSTLLSTPAAHSTSPRDRDRAGRTRENYHQRPIISSVCRPMLPIRTLPMPVQAAAITSTAIATAAAISIAGRRRSRSTRTWAWTTSAAFVLCAPRLLGGTAAATTPTATTPAPAALARPRKRPRRLRRQLLDRRRLRLRLLVRLRLLRQRPRLLVVPTLLHNGHSSSLPHPSHLSGSSSRLGSIQRRSGPDPAPSCRRSTTPPRRWPRYRPIWPTGPSRAPMERSR